MLLVLTYIPFNMCSDKKKEERIEDLILIRLRRLINSLLNTFYPSGEIFNHVTC